MAFLYLMNIIQTPKIGQYLFVDLSEQHLLDAEKHL